MSGLRTALAVADLALAALVLAAVLRLTGSRAAAALGGIVALVAPWALREHAQLIPETFGTPLLLAAALAASRRRTSWLAGALGGLAVAFKLPFLLPAAAIAIVAVSRRAALGSLAIVALLAAAISGLGLGSGLWRGAVEAQGQTGLSSLHDVRGLWLQAAWNLLPLAVPAAVALRLRRSGDTDLLRTVAVGGAAALVLLLGLVKNGSYLNAIVPAEAFLVVLAACGCVWAPTSRPLVAAVAAAVLLGVAQAASLLVSPTDPRVFTRPAAASSAGWPMSDARVDRAVAAARACPPGAAYSGPPYLAFAAGRRLPGNQPDQFILTAASTNERFLAAANRDRARCP